ncbi:MAG TPA: 23S rRNA (adenine(2030)-N(6))-methyltransferase RlmJ [Acetobacteraceae bacterium]|nr:23S rRNA (adenine(2030)-N(6))-methyltransferase RlmJ [Acetobacteraceae bacterium]
MNYRHAFHAGNFADCVKHAVLVWLLRALQRKPAPIFVLDTHAGVGRYDLTTGPAARTGEWRNGIARLLDDPPAVLRDYLDAVRAPPSAVAASVDQHSQMAGSMAGHDEGWPDDRWEAAHYPGSPCLIRALLRPDDRLACCELHSEDASALRQLFARDRHVAVHQRDAWEALGALLPPKERRGLVLIDPPYEDRDEFAQVGRGLAASHARFANGVFVAWYPIKQRAPVRQFLSGMQQSGIRDIVSAELCLREPVDAARLNGCGLLVTNPPYRFEEEVRPILEALLARLGDREPGEYATITRITNE